MAQASAGLRPAVGSINGLAAPGFDGVDDLLAGSTNHMSDLLAVGGYEYWLVWLASSITANDASDPRNDQSIFSDGSGFLWCTLAKISGFSTLYAGHRDSGNKYTTHFGFNAALPHVINVSFDGSRIRSSLDGNSDQTVSAGNVGSMTATNVVFGKCLSAYFAGTLGAAIFCQAEQGSTQRANVTAALKAKYGIA